MDKKLVSVVVPMYFEEEVAQECYNRLSKVMGSLPYDYELVFVNDGSTDRTLPILEELSEKDPRVKVISFARNFGHQIAVTAGLDRAKGDAVVVIDADLQDPPQLIEGMLELWEQGYHVVYAKRKKRQGETWFKLMTAKWFYRFLNAVTEVDIPLDTGDFRLMDRAVVNVFNNMPEKNRFIRGMVSWIGFKQTPIEYERHERFAGETKYPLKKMLKLATDGILSFSFKPIKWMEGTGVVFFLAGLLMMVYRLILVIQGKGIWNGGGTGLLFTLSGIHLLALGVIGEYLVRIYDETRKRPLYTVEKEINLEEER